MIKVLSPGFYTTVQDMGRFGYADKGVPCSGVMDRYSAQLANQIIGNNDNDSLLEIALGKLTLLFEKQTVICISGANLSPKINENSIDLNKALLLKKNDVLSFEKPVFGVRAYLAVKGGFQTPKVLGSRSLYNGITSQTILKKDDYLQISNFIESKSLKNALVKHDQEHFTDKILLAYPGPEYELLSFKQKTQLRTVVFNISNDNNRMGYRLEGLIENELPSMLTSAVLPGTVQLTPSGRLIVLMRDCQVTGGYPRVLQLSETAISRLAQKTTGDKIQFKLESQD
ncbi:biotin-dependent carboxyltransferase family protein [Aureibaculum sp. 2210JD6-5]|uniref:5-oxoprolinase subunit C family protein n=1 Tax=Aureibaculum sp. 2210JD6-5 TaxID=3103957 RepID=UPI002AAE727A|nr:biotin-dependent carboxyltransferase family protein [Aureibaculum sp. 2210JD6-5]MDY7393830.1 biotin-dependent carboxyltransferase family protein [Aureibaculum sp. 2210JD6-5]